MAVLSAFPGLTTEIIVDRLPLTEFSGDEPEASTTKTTSYIEARSGAEFSIKTTLSRPFPLTNGVEVSVSVDGNLGRRLLFQPNDQSYDSAGSIKGVVFVQDGKRYSQNYQFAELNVGMVSLKTLLMS